MHREDRLVLLSAARERERLTVRRPRDVSEVVALVASELSQVPAVGVDHVHVDDAAGAGEQRESRAVRRPRRPSEPGRRSASGDDAAGRRASRGRGLRCSAGRHGMRSSERGAVADGPAAETPSASAATASTSAYLTGLGPSRHELARIVVLEACTTDLDTRSCVRAFHPRHIGACVARRRAAEARIRASAASPAA